MKSYIFLVLCLFLVSSCTQSTSKPITEFSQNDINTGILVDVRTPDEYEAGHIDNSLNFNWFASDFADNFQDIAKNKTIYLYCKKGGRSRKAANLLDSLGYKNVINLEGGYDAWLKKD